MHSIVKVPNQQQIKATHVKFHSTFSTAKVELE